MSDVDTYRGKLIPVELGEQTLDQWIQKRIGRSELEDYESSWLEALQEDLYGSYYYDRSSETLYEIQRERLDPNGFVHSKRNLDGSFDFLVSYYNGGASFGEVMDEVVGQGELNLPTL